MRHNKRPLPVVTINDKRLAAGAIINFIKAQRKLAHWNVHVNHTWPGWQSTDRALKVFSYVEQCNRLSGCEPRGQVLRRAMPRLECVGTHDGYYGQARSTLAFHSGPDNLKRDTPSPILPKNPTARSFSP
jgi:hypothetical protein